MKMKTITFEGREYEAPDWVRWVARDMDGSIYGYSAEPEPCDDNGYQAHKCEPNTWTVDDFARLICIYEPPDNGWERSLVEAK